MTLTGAVHVFPTALPKNRIESRLFGLFLLASVDTVLPELYQGDVYRQVRQPVSKSGRYYTLVTYKCIVSRCLTHKLFVPSPRSWIFYSVPPLLGVSSTAL